VTNFEESLQDTLSERATLVSKVSELTLANEELQHSTKELGRQLSIERQRIKLEEKVKLDRNKWKQETNQLLTSIHEQCNVAFQSTIRELQNESSPRTVFMNEDLTYQKDFLTNRFTSGRKRFEDIPDPECSGTQRSPNDFYELQSPFQVNKTLDETEAMLQHLLGDEIPLKTN
jgi:LPS O-antigen subunit length determinant protein (WzzB/FepE family)